MSATPSPQSQPTAEHEPSPRSQPAAPHALPDRSIPPSSLDNSAQPSTGDGKPGAAAFIPSWRRPTIAIDGADGANRRPSVQFVPHSKTTGSSRSSSAKPTSERSKGSSSVGGGPSAASTASSSSAYRHTGPGGRRLSSPPPPAQFRPSVSFDTFRNPSASDFSLTLNRKHRDYEYTRRSRTFLCGTDTNDYSDTALEWLIDELVDDGDEVVCLRVVEKDSREAAKWSGGQGEKGYREEAERFLETIEKKNTDDRAISLVLEFSIGKVHDTIQQMIRIYEPAILVVGTRGRSLTGYSGLLSSGSVSKYCLQYSPVPVIVVRPSSKREAKKRKRLRDPSRTGYRDILDKSEDAPRGQGGHLLDAQNRFSVTGSDLGALGAFDSAADQNEEARRVAEAIGYRGSGRAALGEPRGSSLSRVTSARSDVSNRSDADSLQSPPGRLLKSPELRNVDSPPGSDEDIEPLDVDETPEPIRPEDEAAMLAYERAQKVVEEEREEAEARAKRQADRSASRGRQSSRGRKNSDGESGGAAVLGLLAQLDRGMK